MPKLHLILPMAGRGSRFFENGFVCTTSDEVRAAVERIADEGLDCLDPALDRDRFSRRHQNRLIEEVLLSAARETG